MSKISINERKHELILEVDGLDFAARLGATVSL